MTLQYCPDLHERTARFSALYGGAGEDRILAVMEVPRQALRSFARQYAPGPCERPRAEERAAFWDAFLRETADLHDDRIPSAYLSELDQGLYGGLLGGDVKFSADTGNGRISSMVFPMLQDWSGFDALELDKDGEWARYYRHQLVVFVRAAEGNFGVSHFILIDGLNFLFELFGATRTYMEVEDNPEKVRRAIQFAGEINAWVQDLFFERVPPVDGGTCSNIVSWAPGRVVSESVDPFHMGSPSFFEKWGAEPMRRTLSRYDGGIVHIHGNGRHLIEPVSGVSGVRAICAYDDGDVPPALSVLSDLKRRARGLPLVVVAPFGEFTKALEGHRLHGGVLYRVFNVPDKDTANRTMEEVRRYRV